MPRRSLLRDVSISELMSMRASGMSNAEIAESLGVAHGTILRLIGKQPPMQKRYVGSTYVERASTVALPASASVPDDSTSQESACLAVMDRQLKLGGALGVYVVSAADKTVCLGDLTIPFDKLGVLIDELSAIKRKVHTVNVGVEAW